MLGSHDTYTYLKANNILANAVSSFWRCQTLTIDEQYKIGARVFDVRVIHEEKDGMLWWRIGHGFAELQQRFPNLQSICLYFKEQYPGSVIRLVLEKNCTDEEAKSRFITEAEKIKKKFSSMIWCVCIKKPWTEIWRGTGLKTVKKTEDLICHLFNWDGGQTIAYNLKHINNLDLSITSIKKWAQKHNPKEITQEMIDDPTTLYIMDYLGVYPKML